MTTKKVSQKKNYFFRQSKTDDFRIKKKDILWTNGLKDNLSNSMENKPLH